MDLSKSDHVLHHDQIFVSTLQTRFDPWILGSFLGLCHVLGVTKYCKNPSIFDAPPERKNRFRTSEKKLPLHPSITSSTTQHARYEQLNMTEQTQAPVLSTPESHLFETPAPLHASHQRKPVNGQRVTRCIRSGTNSGGDRSRRVE